MSNPGDDNDVKGVAAVTSGSPRIPMPKLSESLRNLKVYFTSLGFWFDACGVTSDLKRYSAVMAQIPISELTELLEEIGEIPSTGKYEYIKPFIIARFSASRQKRFQEALNETQLGDNKPSQLFQKLKQLAGDSLTEAALIDLWVARLPEMAHATVIQMSKSPLRERITAADAITDSLRLRGTCESLINQASTQATEISKLDQLSLQVEELQIQMNNYVRSQPQEYQRGRTSKNKPKKEYPTCWYHWKYGARAPRCNKPCNFEETK